jgi:autotransporter-associated beta strand protein
MKSPILFCAVVLTLSLGALNAVYAGSATWSPNPVSGDWNTAANWIPNTVPNGPNDVATFSTSDITVVTVSTSVEVNSVVFDSGASPFTINPNSHLITISGVGVVNNSGITQNFVINLPSFAGFVYFKGSATSGDLVQYMMSGTDPNSSGFDFFDNTTAATSTFVMDGGDSPGMQTGQLTFWDTSSAENATIILNGGSSGAFGGTCIFNANATASHARIFANGATISGGSGGFVLFQDPTATADHAVITLGGSDVGGAGGISFQFSATAANATLIAEAGQASGGGIDFFQCCATGGTAKVKLFGNGSLIDFIDSSPVEIGSLEGDGAVSLGILTGANLAVGSNNLSTIFSGLIGEHSRATRSSLTKIGTGMLELSGANTYTGGTIVSVGGLVIDNMIGSGTGTGPVQVNGGILAGSGIIAGRVTVGTGSGAGGFLTPGMGKSTATTLTIQSALTFKSDSTYTCRLNTKKTKADQLIADGVTIESGAQFAFKVTGDQQLRIGKSATVISNTAATPIGGTFANLPDGSIITVGSNTFQADYEGGDGNDLTLTVVQ